MGSENSTLSSMAGEASASAPVIVVSVLALEELGPNNLDWLETCDKKGIHGEDLVHQGEDFLVPVVLGVAAQVHTSVVPFQSWKHPYCSVSECFSHNFINCKKSYIQVQFKSICTVSNIISPGFSVRTQCERWSLGWQVALFKVMSQTWPCKSAGASNYISSEKVHQG